MQYSWQLDTPIDAVTFDCDSTLSRVEGIDELAQTQAVASEVAQLTHEAMNKTGLNVDLYQQRLNLVKPNRCHLAELAEKYYAQRSPDIESVLSVLRHLGKTVYIISAGINPAVKLFGERLGFTHDTIHAVDILFNANDQYLDFDKESPLVSRNGKRIIISQIKQQYPRVVHIGDGLNDIEALDLVARFIGYGGACYRASIARLCDFYIHTPSLLPILPLTLTPTEFLQLPQEYQQYYQQGMALIQQQEVTIKGLTANSVSD